MKKGTAIALISIIVVFFSLCIWTFFTKGNYLIIGGSTSCNEFMQEVTEKYKQEEVIYSSIGSQAGINSLKNRSLVAGFISKNVPELDFGKPNLEPIFNTEYSGDDLTKYFKNHEKEANSYYSLQFAYDAIEIVYYPPSWWLDVKTSDTSINDLLSFYIKSSTKDIFNTNDSQKFLKKAYTDKNYTWQQLARDLIELKIKDKDIKKSLKNKIPKSNSKFLSYTRESGSGTRDSFESMTGLADLTSSNVCNSNGVMLTSVESTPGSIGYISYAFSNSIKKDSVLKVAGINDLLLGLQNSETGSNCSLYDQTKNKYILLKDKDNNVVTNTDAIKEDNYYSFKRPFITLFNSGNKNFQKLLSFYSFMLGNKESENEINEVYEKTGLVKKIVLNKY